MSEDIARLNLGIDTGDTVTAKAEIVRSLDEIKAAAGRTAASMDQVSKHTADELRKVEAEYDRVYGSGSGAAKSQNAAKVAKQVADAYTAELKAAHEAAIATIKQAEAAQFITPAEAKKFARAAGQAYNQELGGVMRQVQKDGVALANGVNGMASGQDVFNEMGKGMQKITKETPLAIAGLGRLRYTLAPLAAQALDLPPIFGRIGSVLGAFAVGGVVTLAVVAGLAAMGWAWRKLSEDNQKDADRMKKNWEEVIKVAEKARGSGSAAEVLADAKRRLAGDENKENLAHGFTSMFRESFGGIFAGNKTSYEKSLTPGSEADKAAKAFLPGIRDAIGGVISYIPKLWEDKYAGQRVKDQTEFDRAKPVLTAQARSDNAEMLSQRLGAKVFTPQELDAARKSMQEALANYKEDVKSGNNDAAKVDLATYTNLKSAIEGVTKARMSDKVVIDTANESFQRLKQQSDALIASTQQQDGPMLQFRNKIVEVKNAMDALDMKYEHVVKKTPALTAQHNTQHAQFQGILDNLNDAQTNLGNTEKEKLSTRLDTLAGRFDTTGASEAKAQLASFDDEAKELRNNIVSLGDAFNTELLQRFDKLAPVLRTQVEELGRVNIAAKATAGVLSQYRGQDSNQDTYVLDQRLKDLQAIRATITTESALKAIDEDINRVLDVRNNILTDQQKNAKEIKAIYTDAAKQMKSAWSGLFDDMLNGNMRSFKNFFDNILKMFRQMLANMAATAFINAMKKPIQNMISKVMDGYSLKDALTGGGPAIPDKAFGVGPSMAQKAMKYGGAAIGGAVVGYGLGSMTTNKLAGTAMGALGGAATGFAVGGPVGAIVGGIAGAVGGLFGSSKKAKQAAKDMQQARDQFAMAMDDYVATATRTNSVLKQSLAQNEQQRKALIQAANAAYPGKKREGKRNQEIDAINEAAKENAANLIQDFRDNLDSQLNLLQGNTLADQIEKINKAYQENLASVAAAGNAQADLNKATDIYTLSLKQVNDAYKQDVAVTKGSLQVRALEARGQEDAAARLKMQIDQAKELADATAKWGQTNPEIIQQLKEVQALERANGASALSTAVRNGPEGFRVESYTTQFAVMADKIGTAVSDAITDAFSDALDKNDIKAPTVIFQLPDAHFSVDGSSTPEQTLASLVSVLKQKTLATSGINGKLSATLDKL